MEVVSAFPNCICLTILVKIEYPTISILGVFFSRVKFSSIVYKVRVHAMYIYIDSIYIYK